MTPQTCRLFPSLKSESTFNLLSLEVYKKMAFSLNGPRGLLFPVPQFAPSGVLQIL